MRDSLPHDARLIRAGTAFCHWPASAVAESCRRVRKSRFASSCRNIILTRAARYSLPLDASSRRLHTDDTTVPPYFARSPSPAALAHGQPRAYMLHFRAIACRQPFMSSCRDATQGRRPPSRLQEYFPSAFSSPIIAPPPYIPTWRKAG